MATKKHRRADMAQLARSRAEGKSIRKISEETGIPRSTVGDYLKDPQVQELQNAAVEALKQQYLDIARMANEKIDSARLDRCSAPQLMMVSGTATDKVNILSGNRAGNPPTIIINIRDPRLPFKVEASDNEGQPQTIEITPE